MPAGGFAWLLDTGKGLANGCRTLWDGYLLVKLKTCVQWHQKMGRRCKLC